MHHAYNEINQSFKAACSLRLKLMTTFLNGQGYDNKSMSLERQLTINMSSVECSASAQQKVMEIQIYNFTTSSTHRT